MIDVFHWDRDGNVTRSDDYTSTPESGWVWVDLVDESMESIQEVGTAFSLDALSIEETMSENNLPLIEEQAGYVFLVLHGLAFGSGERLTTPEIDIFLGTNFLITIRDATTLSVDTIKQKIADGEETRAASPSELLASMALSASRRTAPLIVELQRQADKLEELALQADPNTIVQSHALRRDVILLRRALSPQYEVYRELSDAQHPTLTADARRRFNRVADAHMRALESLEAGRALLLSVLEIYRGAVADQTNEIMRVLTVFSAILLPLTLVAGLWGMNFLMIPGSEVENGFWWLAGVMAATALGLWLYFARRGFIGAPRLRDIPKAVGLGLFTLGTAPIRVVAGGLKQLGRTGDSDS